MRHDHSRAGRPGKGLLVALSVPKARSQVQPDDLYLVALPLRGRIGSLNVSAAAAVLLYGMLQRRARG